MIRRLRQVRFNAESKLMRCGCCAWLRRRYHRLSRVGKIVTNLSCVIVFIASIILFALSFDTFLPHELALDLNTVTQTVDSTKLWTGGAREVIGLFHHFVKFQGSIQSIRFANPNSTNALYRPVEARTSDGVKIYLNVTVMYQLIPTLKDVQLLYNSWGDEAGVKVGLLMTARQGILDVSSHISVFRFFMNRTSVMTEIEDRVRQHYAAYGVRLHRLLIENIDLQPQLVEALSDVELARMENIVESILYHTTGIQTQTRVLEFEYETERIIIEGHASANSLRIKQVAEASALAHTLATEKTVYSDVCRELVFDVPQFLEFVYNRALLKHGKSIISVKNGFE